MSECAAVSPPSGRCVYAVLQCPSSPSLPSYISPLPSHRHRTAPAAAYNIQSVHTPHSTTRHIKYLGCNHTVNIFLLPPLRTRIGEKNTSFSMWSQKHDTHNVGRYLISSVVCPQPQSEKVCSVSLHRAVARASHLQLRGCFVINGTSWKCKH